MLSVVLTEQSIFLLIQLKQTLSQGNKEVQNYLQVFQYNENVLKGVIDWNTEEHGNHVTVQLQGFICAAPEYCDNYTLINM